MKIDKKTIAIVLVVAVAAWLLWKRRSGNAAVSAANEPAVMADSLESLIAGSGMTSTDAAYVRNLRDTISNTWREQLQQKAAQSGTTYEQQLILAALWVKYYDNATGDFKSGVSDSTKSYVWRVMAAVRNA